MAGDPYWNNVVLAMHMDDVGLSDLKGHAVTLNGNAARSSVQSKFGGHSAALVGAGDYLSAGSNAAFAFGAGDFTIECWVRFADVSAAGVIYDGRNLTQTSGVVLYRSAAAKLTFYTSSADRIVGTSSIAASTWYHVAICKSGGSTKLFLNGVQDGSTYSDSNNYTDTLVTIGADRAGSSMYMNGYIDDLRITKGVARYTGTFPIPTEAFPSTPPQISGTVKDSTGAFVARTVRAYRRSDGILTGSTTSNGTTGAFTVSAYDDTAHFVTAFDSGAENALIFDNITPL